ncbi:MAG: hypothetical protein B6D59_06750 [Campylobacteraceae bacterium 4484_4]|nr:MAG: hypothetical protein B6D59_06750 [Campylobacteraceae bacterium 4484_4]
MSEYFIFKLMDENYAIELAHVKEILVHSQVIITPLFTEPKWVEGVLNLRGEVIPVVDLRVRFGATKPLFDEETVIIVIRTEEQKLIGIIVDKIELIHEITGELLTQTDEMGIGIDPHYIKGLAKISSSQMSVVLDIDTVLNIEELTTI